jgi:hypothetical protein
VPGLRARRETLPRSPSSGVDVHESSRSSLSRAGRGTRRRCGHAVRDAGRECRASGTARPQGNRGPAGNKIFLVGHATGVQIYSCSNGAWGPASTPRATLVDDKRKVVATHFGGPTWQARDGSAVVGARVNGVDARDPKKAIPWLLLKVASTAPGPRGDQFVKTTFIQRVNTSGGVAPPPAAPQQTCPSR